jgi:chromosome segregation ATPase
MSNCTIPPAAHGTLLHVCPTEQELEDELANMRQEIAAAQEVAAKASSTWDRFRKERDFHRMHHKRVAQEKNKLIADIKRLKVRAPGCCSAAHASTG